MSGFNLEKWLSSVLPKHGLLSSSVVAIVESLLRSEKVEFLAVTSRVKDLQSAIQKVNRKGYKDPERQLTDLSGIRIIVFFESDVVRVSNIIKTAFEVDEVNSSNKDAAMSVDQIGYRSVHFVCGLGSSRSKLPEYKALEGLKFEFQVRTVLQHAWAELAHDRNYKFSGSLPKDAQRKLFLYAGMLELADKGFDELSREIDSYIESVKHEVEVGDLNIDIDSISLKEFVEGWAAANAFKLKDLGGKENFSDLITELRHFGVATLSELAALIPEDFASRAEALGYGSTIYGVVRDWMLIKDWRRFIAEVPFNWVMGKDDIIATYIAGSDYEEFHAAIPSEPEFDFEEYERDMNEDEDEDEDPYDVETGIAGTS